MRFQYVPSYHSSRFQRSVQSADNRPVGWRGSGGLAVATTTTTIWFGGMLLILAGIGEFLLGNNFPMIVFLAYGAHLLSFSTTFIPWFNSVGFYNPDGSGIGSPGANNQTSVFLASYGKIRQAGV
jgi:succinate-acetate transporter protein